MVMSHPIGALISRLSRNQITTAGDGKRRCKCFLILKGSTTAVLLASELIKEAAKMMEGDIHATPIVHGYTKASKLAIEKLKSCKVHILDKEIPNDEKELLEMKIEPKRQILLDVCMSVLNTRLEKGVAKVRFVVQGSQ